MVNTNKIKGRMKELELTQADVAHCLNIAQPTANQKKTMFVRLTWTRLRNCHTCSTLMLESSANIFLLSELHNATSD